METWPSIVSARTSWLICQPHESAIGLLTRTVSFSRGISSHLLLMLGRAGCGNPETEFWSWEDKGCWWEHPLPLSLSKFQEIVKDREAWCAAVRGVSKSRTWLSDWTAVQQQPTPIFLPGEFQWQRSLVDYSPRGCKELDTTEWLTVFSFSLHAFYYIICYYFYLLD